MALYPSGIMSKMLEGLLPLVNRPSRYIDGEVNVHGKDPQGAEVLFALAFPDLYEIGMSYVGLQILYRLLNALPGVVCERVFSPFLDLEGRLRAERLPLVSLESRIPLKDFDIVGFSLQYELTYTNLLNILELGGIPLLASERQEDMPLVIAGGPCAMQPEPLTDFIDAFVLGDAEHALPQLVETFRKWKEAKGTKGELLEALSEIPGVYVPSLFEVGYDRDGRIVSIRPLKEGYCRVNRQILSDLDSVPYPTSPIVPLAKVVHDRLSIEVVRGCSRGCRFCQAGFIYRPVRERDPRGLLEVVEEALRRTGYDEVSLLALSIGDCSYLIPLVQHLMSKYGRERVALSLPSIRVGTLAEEVVKEIKRVRKTGFTIAPEAGTERLQRVINKIVPEEEVIFTARTAFEAGWRSLKLYFMVGLPTEREEDVKAIVSLAKRVTSLGGQANVSVSTFVPKAHTPFQWERMIGLEEIYERHRLLKTELRGRRLRLKWHEPRMSFLEGVFSRGDRRLGKVLLEAYRRGCRFDGWTEHLQWKRWLEAFEASGIDPLFYLRERYREETLPWNHLNSGVKTSYLWMEREKAYAGEVTEECQPGCRRCGLCREGTEVRIAPPFTPPLLPKGIREVIHRKPWVRKIRARFLKLGRMRFLGHLEMVDTFIRALRRAGVPLKYSEGFHPLPKVVFTTPLPVGVESLAEYVDVEISRYIRPSDFLEGLNSELPEGLKVVEAYEMAFKGVSLPNLFREDLFLVPLAGWITPGDAKDLVEKKLASGQLLMKVQKKSGFKTVDVLAYLEEIRVTKLREFTPVVPLPQGVPPLEELLKGEWALSMRVKKGLKPFYLLQGIFDLGEEEVKRLQILKVESLPPLL